MSVPPVPRRSGLSLAERARVTEEIEHERATSPATGPPTTRPAASHCWVTGLEAAPGQWPGIVTEWRTTPTGWEGRVVYAVIDGASSVLIQAWVSAHHLSPAVAPA